jgi:hypothetical protein
MFMSNIRHGLCVTLLAASAMFGIAACGVAPEDEAQPGTTENVTEDAEPLTCGYGGPPAHCLGLCCSHANWSDLGVPAAGQCTQTVNDYCQARGGNCGNCWGYL